MTLHLFREGLDSLLKDLVLSEEGAERWEKVRRVVFFFWQLRLFRVFVGVLFFSLSLLGTGDDTKTD